MSGPDRVRLKRRRSELPPDTLIVEPSFKRTHTDDVSVNVRYVRQKEPEQAPTGNASQAQRPKKGAVGLLNKAKLGGLEEEGTGATTRQGVQQSKRTFHLKRPDTPESGSKKRKAKDEDLATFVEKKAKHGISGIQATPRRSFRDVGTLPRAEEFTEPFKRPGRSSAVQAHSGSMDGVKQNGNLRTVYADNGVEALASDMHQFALDEIARDTNQRSVAKPKLSAERSRALHKQRMSTARPTHAEDSGGVDLEMDDESDFVYDTYILAPAGDVDGAQPDSHVASPVDLGNVGYLVIEAANQTLWEAYVEDDGTSPGSNSDEEDENAEDYYGADYPEDELASDDELDRGAYGYRVNAGSDDEQWDEDTGTWSDVEEDRMKNPFSRQTPLPKQHFRYPGGEDEDD